MTGNGGVFLYVSEADSGRVSVLRMDDDGALTRVQEVPVGGELMPMAITPDRRLLFVAARAEPMTLAGFAINGLDGTLSPTGSVPAPYSAAYLSTDRTGRYLLAAYNVHTQKTGVLSVHAIGADGAPQLPPMLTRTPPKIHSIVTDPANRFALAPSCNGDVIMRYSFDAATGEISPDGLAPVIVLPDAGPRHPQFHPNRKFFYLINEYDASIVVYRYDAAKGSLHEIQTVSAAPAGQTAKKSDHGGWRAADIHLTPDGRWLYGSVRNTSEIVSFSVDPLTGLLAPRGRFPTAREPRSFAIDPSGRYMFAAGFHEKNLIAFKLDSGTGELTRLKEYAMGDGPNWVECVRLP
jgi:6-phosphogluconolactonase